jgi:hypothetical protein
MNEHTGYKPVIAVNSSEVYTLHVKIFDVAGECLRKVPVMPNGKVNQVQADFSELASGMYFGVVDLINSEGEVAKHQVIKIVVVR